MKISARPTRKAILASVAVLAAGGALVVAARLRATVRHALQPVSDTRRPLQFLASHQGPPLARWGSAAVEAVASRRTAADRRRIGRRPGPGGRTRT